MAPSTNTYSKVSRVFCKAIPEVFWMCLRYVPGLNLGCVRGKSLLTNLCKLPMRAGKHKSMQEHCVRVSGVWDCVPAGLKPL